MILFLCLPLLAGLLQPIHCQYNCSAEYERTPVNSDLSVECGTKIISLEINYCTAKWSGFNYSNLALNGKHNTTECQGLLDTSVNPPVIRFQLPINQSQDNPCRHSLQIADEAPDPTGPFSDFLSVQSVIITSFIDTPRSDQGVISYATDLYYHFSCRYPLEYLINNTEIAASSVSVATSDNNGTFIKNLKMSVFNDSSFAFPLMTPPTGLDLRTLVFVQVKAINLTGNFHLLLDHCFATPTAYNLTNTEQHNFFTGCSVDQRTVVLANGLSTTARFNFEAFRFVQHRNQAKSSLYLHCILRLCEPDTCQSILAACNSRKKRSVTPFGKESSESATITVGPLFTSGEERPYASAYSNAGTSAESDVDVTGLVVGVVLGSAAAVLLVLGGWFVLKKYYLTGGLARTFG